jgi:hypothetical protein
VTTLLPSPFADAPTATGTEATEPIEPLTRSDPIAGPDARRYVVAVGHDAELWVLWLRLDARPSPGWVAAFEEECRQRAVAVRLHGAHVLCTATEADQRRRTKQARRIIGAANGAVSPS